MIVSYFKLKCEMDFKTNLILILLLGYVSSHPHGVFEESGDIFDDDIILTEEQKAALLSKNGMTNLARRWPGAIVPYTFENAAFSKSFKHSISKPIFL